MTISATHSRKDYVGNGVLATYPFDFTVFASSDLKVYVEGSLKTLGVHYTVTGTLPGTGNVVFTAGNIPALNAAIIIEGNTPLTQATDLNAGEMFYEENVERMADKATILLQQIKNRSLQIPLGHPVAGPIPFPSLLSSKFLRANPAGTGLEFVAGSLADIVGVLDDVVPVSTDALFPVPGTAGRLRGKTDVSRSLWMDNGSQWVSINGGLFNVMDFEAVGDGVTDDSAAIQAAVNAAADVGGCVFFPGRKFLVATTISVPGIKPVHIQGVGNANYRAGIGQIPDVAVFAASGDFAYGSRIRYTGSGRLFNCQTTRSTTFEKLVMLGPGHRVAGSKCIAFTNSVSSNVFECAILAFETAIELGADGDGNGDTNYICNNFIISCVYGIRFKQTQNLINTIIHNMIQARECVKADYAVGVNIFGGWYIPNMAELNVDYWEATITGKNGKTYTLDDASNALPGMQILTQHGGDIIGANYKAEWVSPMNYIDVVSGDDVTVRFGDGSDAVTVGDVVVFGYLPVVFQMSVGSINGVHIEGGESYFDGKRHNHGILWTGPSAPFGRSAVVMENSVVSQGKEASAPSYLDLMIPSFVNYNGTGSLAVRLEVRSNVFNIVFPKVQCSAESIFEMNSWFCNPVWTSYNGRVPTELRTNDAFAWHWGVDVWTAATMGYFNNLLDYRSSFKAYQPQAWYGRVSYDEPTHLFSGEFMAATGDSGDGRIIGWRERAAGGGSDGSLRSTVTLTTQGSMQTGTNKFVVTNLHSSDTGIRPHMRIKIPGAGPAAADLETTVMFINGHDNTIFTFDNASTTVSGVTLATVAPNVKKYGRQAEFGSAAPVSGTWQVGDICWNTSPAAGQPAYWICTVAGTPGTWKASANLV